VLFVSVEIVDQLARFVLLSTRTTWPVGPLMLKENWLFWRNVLVRVQAGGRTRARLARYILLLNWAALGSIN